MTEANSPGAALPEGLCSLLDTDLYKLTMQCAILKYLPDVPVTYAFTNRTPHMRLTRDAYRWLEKQVEKLGNIAVSLDELQFLRKTCPYLTSTYLRFLSSFRLRPTRQVHTTFTPLRDTGSPEDVGDLRIDVEGRWLDTILYEVPLLALISEAYFKFCDKDWNHDDQQERAYDKGVKLMANGCVFSEFGSRRRRNYHTQDLVLQGLTRASDEALQQGWQGKLGGTSNVHFAMKYGILPVGTVAHEWFMGIASITNDYTHANETALRYWVGCFGEGVLGIALTDTFGTPIFLKAFSRTMPTPHEADTDAVATQIPGATDAPVSPPDSPKREQPGLDYVASKGRSYAQIFQGVRQDSGNPVEFVKLMRDFYRSEGITDKKTIVFSDSLNVERCLEYKKAAEEAGFSPTFGVGTFLTNDFTHLTNGTKSDPLNIVIKLSSANGRPAIKISDNVGKNTGDLETVHKVKETLGYVERSWAQGNEKTRWGRGGAEASTATNQEK
ncbi:MAG: nicotinate phosphoribosyltransferase [Heterodermia speciosa]|uniref:nicotinate phosphoribosyltransferase n=1 Tax=Heterodermia speciosa TaxID=116794 RepID=A0A8H3FXX9_9LECA|nr:MAG: nicotinate phosphoribosyltransferase [Heterodermia speciosa]